MKILSEKIEVLQRYPQKSILAIFQMFTLVADIYELVLLLVENVANGLKLAVQNI